MCAHALNISGLWTFGAFFRRSRSVRSGVRLCPLSTTQSEWKTDH